MGNNTQKQKAWIISVSMGYGHQRTAYPLRHLAPNEQVINANHYPGIPKNDRRIWETSRNFYEFISDFKRFPLIGEPLFAFFNRFQKILSYYPKRDLSKPSFQLRQVYALIKKGWGKQLIEMLKKNPLPIISTFFTPAFMAEVWNYPNDIYCVVCDADIARTWAPFNPKESKIKYLTPNRRTASRLKLYGVKEENIFVTGYPLPVENIGSPNMEIVKHDLKNRLINLDPKKEYRQQYDVLIKKYLGPLPEKSDHPLTIMFSVGGAGAQKEMAIQIIKSLTNHLKNGEIKIILSAGIKEKVKNYFLQQIKHLKLENYLGKSIEILWQPTMNEYFKEFNQALRKTDVLWTKPSELSFYSALGIPIILAPTIGSQEDFNRDWLLQKGAAICQENPRYTNEWFFDYWRVGAFAEAAMQGFVEIEKMGVYKIEKIISK
jgi:UDP-N-acetylglucosamine:LPS N-acetylglucosamine transferase